MSDPVPSPQRGPIAVLVLAGGRSSRFGSDKTRVEVDGVPLLERVVSVVRALDVAVDEVLVVGPWAPLGVRHLLEPDRFGGPLAALAFALGQVTAPNVLVLAADHPHLEPSLLELLLDRLASDDEIDAVVPIRDGRREPLVAAYRRSVAADAHGLLVNGARSLQALLDALVVDEISDALWREFDPDGRSFVDVDHRGDLPDNGR